MNKLVKTAVIVLVVLILIAGIILAYFSIREYRPKEIEDISVNGKAVKKLTLQDSVTVLTYNIGYGGTSADMDFFMDGGKMTEPSSLEIVERNVQGAIDIMKEQDADVVFIQEVDRNSKRSYRINEMEMITGQMNGNSSFANNFLCDFVPYPLSSPIGKVDAGLLTLTKFEVAKSQRYKLPTPFKWPQRTCQLKRALLTHRIPIEGSEKELVLVNFHLEAYDDGTGKKEQTKLLAELLQEEYEKGNYCIAGGDFNQSFPMADNDKYPIQNEEYYIPSMLDITAFSDEWIWAVDDNVPTARLLNEPYNKNNPKTQYYVIDGFILSQNLAVEEVKTINHQFAWSDHNPVLLKVSFADIRPND